MNLISSIQVLLSKQVYEPPLQLNEYPTNSKPQTRTVSSAPHGYAAGISSYKYTRKSTSMSCLSGRLRENQAARRELCKQLSTTYSSRQSWYLGVRQVRCSAVSSVCVPDSAYARWKSKDSERRTYVRPVHESANILTLQLRISTFRIILCCKMNDFVYSSSLVSARQHRNLGGIIVCTDVYRKVVPIPVCSAQKSITSSSSPAHKDLCLLQKLSPPTYRLGSNRMKNIEMKTPPPARYSTPFVLYSST